MNRKAFDELYQTVVANYKKAVKENDSLRAIDAFYDELFKTTYEFDTIQRMRYWNMISSL